MEFFGWGNIRGECFWQREDFRINAKSSKECEGRERATASAAWERRRLYRYILDRVKNAKRSEVSAAGASALQLAQRGGADDRMKNAKRSEASAAGASSLQLAQRGARRS